MQTHNQSRVNCKITGKHCLVNFCFFPLTKPGIPAGAVGQAPELDTPLLTCCHPAADRLDLGTAI